MSPATTDTLGLAIPAIPAIRQSRINEINGLGGKWIRKWVAIRCDSLRFRAIEGH